LQLFEGVSPSFANSRSELITYQNFQTSEREVLKLLLTIRYRTLKYGHFIFTKNIR